MKVYSAYTQARGGGAFQLWVRLLAAAREAGHSVAYAAPTPIARLEEGGARHAPIPAPVRWRRIGTGLGLLVLALRAIFCWWPGRDSVAISQGSLYSFLLLPLRWKGARLLTIVHGDYAEECRVNQVPGWIVSLTHAAVGIGFRASDALVAVSADLAERTARDFRVPRDRIQVLPAGLPKPPPSVTDTEVLALREALRLGNETLLVYVGQLVPIKRVDVIVDAFAELARTRPATLLVVGDGALRAALESLAEKRGVGSLTHFVGWQPNPAPYLAAADVLVLASDYEGTPIVLMEALSLGVVPVVSRVGGMPEVVGSEALTFPAGDSGALCRTLESVLDPAGRVRADLQSLWRSRAAAYDYVWESRVLSMARGLQGSDTHL